MVRSHPFNFIYLVRVLIFNRENVDRELLVLVSILFMVSCHAINMLFRFGTYTVDYSLNVVHDVEMPGVGN